MARLKTFDGLSEYSQKLAKLGSIDQVTRVMKTALFDGAGTVADAIRSEVNALPIGNKRGKPGKPINTITKKQQEGLSSSLNIADFKRDGWGWSTMVGFVGYNSQQTDDYPLGQPNAMIAASIEGGTSFRQKNPFITRALRKSQKAADEAMKAKADAVISEIMEE